MVKLDELDTVPENIVKVQEMDDDDDDDKLLVCMSFTHG